MLESSLPPGSARPFPLRALKGENSHDRLTGLPSQALLVERLRWSLSEGDAGQRVGAVLALRVDGFHLINDALGHATGDRLLNAIAGRIRGLVREQDMVARLDGVEFAVVLNGPMQEDAAQAFAERLQLGMTEPFELDDGQEVFVTCCIGIAQATREGGHAEQLLAHACLALHHAKQGGRNRIGLFSQPLLQRARETLSLEAELRRALEHGDFELHYQLAVDLCSGAAAGAEALLRWRHAERGLIAPARFIPAAERSGLIIPLGNWVIEQACRQMAEWQQAGIAPPRIAVNLSPRQLSHAGLLADMRGILARSGWSGERLEFELTESTLVECERADRLLRQLAELGITLAVDDFGTGYSSLGYLKRLPIHKIKIDQAFIRDLAIDADSASIVRAVISIARDLQKQVVAEGVETEAQAAFLLRHHCQVVQGFLFSQPAAAAQIAESLQTRQPPRQLLPEHASRTVLLVDDEVQVLRALQRSLRSEGYRILTASRPEEALERMAREPVSVVLTDLMQGVRGVTLLRQVKQLYPLTVRMILTGHAQVDALSLAINEGAVQKFLFKPWENDVLKQYLREACVLQEIQAQQGCPA
ncbi:EAL domain-containing protein [Chitinimonas koreensis]|uniref:EAL domain-containing protein n=1 Tax=Chitinimonas koreensis TaxID=356302 RepID=UPI00041D701A|nr:EAL domain-containing protein [Chitinimonas koreensis]QNM96580.1 EAL domain-containing protein [Chitinimonas koreensis]